MRHDFIQLYNDYFDDIYRYVYYKIGNGWDTDDLVSEIFRKAYEKYNMVNDNPKAWLFCIARNSIIDFYRKKKDIPSSDTLDEIESPNSLVEVIENKEQLKILKKAINQLTKEEAEMINLHYFSDMKYKDMGELLGRSESSIKMRMMRIMKKLKLLVSKTMEG